MKKLYKKSALLFAVLWIIVYVVGSSVAEAFSDRIGSPKSITFALHLLLTVLMAVWVSRNKLSEYYGLCRTDIKASVFLYYIPFAVPVCVNFLFGVQFNKPIAETLFAVGSMLCVGFLEELIFRGFLFRAMAKDSLKAATLVSLLTFGIGHIINLFNGAELLPTFCQVVYAAAFGFLCVIVFHRGKTLLPCIIVHSTVNALSVFANEAVTTQQTVISSLVLFVFAAAYALYLRKKLPTAEAEI